jgi:hypothetical protein
MTEQDANRKRLAHLMDERRIDLRMQWSDVADAIGISVAHLRRIRSGHASLTFKVTRGIDQALRWRNGSTMQIMEGGEPDPLPEAHAASAPSGNARAPLRVVPEWVASEEEKYLDLLKADAAARHLLVDERGLDPAKREDELWVDERWSPSQRYAIILTLRDLDSRHILPSTGEAMDDPSFGDGTDG